MERAPAEDIDAPRPPNPRAPTLHPLAQALGPDWLWMYRAQYDSTIILHPGGLWTELGYLTLRGYKAEEEDWAAMGLMLQRNQEAGYTGKHIVTSTRSEKGDRPVTYTITRA